LIGKTLGYNTFGSKIEIFKRAILSPEKSENGTESKNLSPHKMKGIYKCPISLADQMSLGKQVILNKQIGSIRS
jgi:hypothetical protein